MYQYYNYLIFEKNKESFHDIPSDLRKMTYKYDKDVKNAFMTVQASPEVIKAAMGMNVKVKEESKEVQDQKESADNNSDKIDKPKKVAKYRHEHFVEAFTYFKKDKVLVSPEELCPQKNL